MIKNIILPILLLFCVFVHGQVKPKPKKYPSLFWEITGIGMKKPSYLFGTMHVSSKIAFHLSDSFYVAIRNADVVALETNPETWQEDMERYDLSTGMGAFNQDMSETGDQPADYFTIQRLRFDKYEKKLELALFSRPSMINNLLYRSMSNNSSDFEEDTYLDLYIYQTGKRMKKKVAGVENYEESMRLMSEAYKDAAREKNRKEKSFDFDEDYSPAKLQEAYRTGNLDLLDSINRLTSQSEAFDEKFLYQRNEIQANSIDSILRRSSLFVGVGAAHLPGDRGVIELLRKKGYKLRPIFMGTRDSKQKEAIEKIRVPVTFSTQSSADGFYKVDIPGKFYRFDDNFLLDQEQYADMANGSFYMVSRVKTNSLFWGHDETTLAAKIDSLLYENVPGKIISKTAIVKNGYKGFDIMNRTRRGDLNRYNIFITPYEVIFFKTGGNGDYINRGEEAKRFFASIELKEFINGGWKKFQPSYGSFSVDLPATPYESIGQNLQYDADDKINGQHFSVIRSDIHNYDFAEEDNFDLTLMNESFASSEFIEKNTSRKFFTFKGYPALDCSYKHINGSVIFTRFIIRGPHYYTLVAHGKDGNLATSRFFDSFEFTPYQYQDAKVRMDTVLNFSVNTTWFPPDKKNKEDLPDDDFYQYGDDEEESSLNTLMENNKTRIIKNDTTGEVIYISFSKPGKYDYHDSLELKKNPEKYRDEIYADWIVRRYERSEGKNGWKIVDLLVSDTNSSRSIRTKQYSKNGVVYKLMTESDTLSAPSSFMKSFFENFKPADTIAYLNPYVNKSKVFFDDFFGKDSIARKRAISSVLYVKLDSADLPLLKKAIFSFEWSERNYLDRKKSFINKLGSIPIKASADLLKELYISSGDTIKFQYATLESLLKHKTSYAFNLFREILTTDPPVLDMSASFTVYPTVTTGLPTGSILAEDKNLPFIYNNNFFDELYDSLPLTKRILPDLLPLINLHDYEKPVMQLLRTMVDSGLVNNKDYETYISKFMIEARQALKKQLIEEKKTAIERAEEEKKDNPSAGMWRRDMDDPGNDQLVDYATLLLPFRESNPAVNDILVKILSSSDKRLKYNITILLLRNNITVSDTLLDYFAGLNDYRYELYADLDLYDQLDKFPAAHRSHRELARSKLYGLSYYQKPDSLIFIDSLPATIYDKHGYVFFYKYKMKKDDDFWKLATVGLISDQEDDFIIETGDLNDYLIYKPLMYYGYNASKSAELTEFTEVKIGEDEMLKSQMEKQLKKIEYAKRKSGKEFFTETPDLIDLPFRFYQ